MMLQNQSYTSSKGAHITELNKSMDCQKSGFNARKRIDFEIQTSTTAKYRYSYSLAILLMKSNQSANKFSVYE